MLYCINILSNLISSCIFTISLLQYGFSSFIQRDVSYNIIFKVWQNSLSLKPLPPIGLVRVARKAWGDSTEVGTAEELWGEDGVQPKLTRLVSKKLINWILWRYYNLSCFFTASSSNIYADSFGDRPGSCVYWYRHHCTWCQRGRQHCGRTRESYIGRCSNNVCSSHFA